MGLLLSPIIVKYSAKLAPVPHFQALPLPHFPANQLSLLTVEKPNSLVVSASVLSRSLSNFLVTDKMFFTMKTLRTVPATFFVKSKRTLSILRRALSQVPERMVSYFNFSSCALSRKLKEFFRGTFLGKVVDP